MQLRDDNYPKKTYDDETKFKIKSAIFDLLKQAEHMKCVTCGEYLRPDCDVCIYDHDGGWTLLESIPKQWVSIECRCGYHNSINKLGVRR